MPKKTRSGRPGPGAIWLFQILSNESRRRVFVPLDGGPLTVGTIGKRAGWTATNASGNQGTPYDHDLVSVAIDGTQGFYELTEPLTVTRSQSMKAFTIGATDGRELKLSSKSSE